jgi:predicted  nucleic acid-binding Zn-ribbon protein
MEKLSEKYNAPKEEIAKVVSELEKYAKLTKEIEEVEKKIREEGGDGSYLADLIEKEKKLKKTFEKSRSNLVKQMFKDFQDENSEIKKQIELNEELSDTVDKVGKAQNKLNDAIDEGTKRYEKFKKSGLFDIVSGLWGAVKDLAKASFDKYKEVDQAGHDFGRQMGMTTKDLNKHTSSLFENYRGLAYNLGMEFKEMYKFQTNYADVTQKATMLSMEQVGAMASLTRNTSEEAVSVASKNLDVFSTSADATIEYLAKNLKDYHSSVIPIDEPATGDYRFKCMLNKDKLQGK